MPNEEEIAVASGATPSSNAAEADASSASAGAPTSKAVVDIIDDNTGPPLLVSMMEDNVGGPPLPPGMIAAAHENEMDIASGTKKKPQALRPSKIEEIWDDDEPWVEFGIQHAFGGDDIEEKIRAKAAKDGKPSAALSSPRGANQDNATAAKPAVADAATINASIITPISDVVNPLPDRDNFQQQQAATPVIRPPPRSMLPTEESVRDPSVRMFHEVEATLVPDKPDIPIYDATPVEEEIPWRKRHKKCVFGGIALLVGALTGAVAIGVSLGSSTSDGDGNIADTNNALKTKQPSSVSPTDVPSKRPTSAPTTSPPTNSPIATGNIGNGRCDSFFNNAEFQYDGGDCCQSTCMSTYENSCGVREDSGLVPRKYIGYPNCTDPTQQCPQGVNNCWNSLPQLSGPSKAVISRNGAVMVVASPPQVFEQDGSKWIPRNLPLDEISDSAPQSSVAVSGDGSVVAISLPVDADVLAKGHVKVFRWFAKSDTYEQIGEDIVVDAVTFGVAYGGAVALSDDGSILAIGAPESYTSIQIGFVLVYKSDFYGWNQLAELRGRDGDADDNFGSSLSISSDGKVIAAGSPHAKDWAGYARVYKYNESMATYILTGHFEGDTVGEAFFGNAVSLSTTGDVLAIGAHRSSAGYVDIFEHSSESQEWSSNGKLVGEVGEYFGETLALSGDGRFLVVGSPHTDTLVGANAGSARSYEYNKTAGWGQYLEVLEGAEPFTSFGRSLSISEDGGTLTVGNAGNLYRDDAVGSVNIYRLVGSTTLSSTEFDNPASDAVAITVAIQLDKFPAKTGFSLVCGGMVHASVPIGSLNTPNDARNETFFVANHTKCHFMIFDSAEDGICCVYGKGYYQIYYGEELSSEDNLLAKGGQMFGGHEKITFIAAPPTNLIPVTITLGQGRYGSEDTDFYLRCNDVLETELLRESAFRSRGLVTGDTFLVPNGTLCNFTKTDLYEAGGTYNITIDGTIVAASNSIGFGKEVGFIVAPPGLLPPATITSYCCVNVQIFLDKKPQETGWSLSCDNEVLYEALPGTYPEMYPSILESFCVFNMTSCEFLLTDDFGDGFSGQYKLGTSGDISGRRTFVNGEDFGPFTFNVTHEFDASCSMVGEDEPKARLNH